MPVPGFLPPPISPPVTLFEADDALDAGTLQEVFCWVWLCVDTSNPNRHIENWSHWFKALHNTRDEYLSGRNTKASPGFWVLETDLSSQSSVVSCANTRLDLWRNGVCVVMLQRTERWALFCISSRNVHRESVFPFGSSDGSSGETPSWARLLRIRTDTHLFRCSVFCFIFGSRWNSPSHVVTFLFCWIWKNRSNCRQSQFYRLLSSHPDTMTTTHWVKKRSLSHLEAAKTLYPPWWWSEGP